MSYFYVIRHKVVEFNEPLDEQSYTHTQLNGQQAAFYMSNPNASVQEVLNMQLNAPVEPGIDYYKELKLQAFQEYMYGILGQGYYDEETGWTLFCGTEDINNYATLKNAIIDLPDNHPAEVGTYTGWHESTRGVIYPLLVRYSIYMLPITTMYKKIESAIQYVQTQEQLDAIQW